MSEMNDRPSGVGGGAAMPPTSDDRKALSPSEVYAIVDQAFALILSLQGKFDRVSPETAYEAGKALGQIDKLRSRALKDVMKDNRS